VDEFAPQLTFFFNAHNQFLEEVAKFRAARRMWARLMRHKFGAANPDSWKLRFHTQTAGSTLTAQQPENNVVRVALQALAAVLGGTQSLHTNSMDEALALPSEHAVMVALRTQQVIAFESGVADAVDPLAGSYVIEALTDEIELRANQYLEKIEAIGGALQAIETGYIQREIQESAFQAQKSIESQEAIVVGVNAFDTKDTPPLQLLKVDPAIERTQRSALEDLRRRREEAVVQSSLGRLTQAAAGEENLMPHIIECVEHDVTLGEICHRLRQAWGEYRPPVTV
jgi:methylmalonyl-CoA mutase N-terminal domain/subunit